MGSEGSVGKAETTGSLKVQWDHYAERRRGREGAGRGRVRVRQRKRQKEREREREKERNCSSWKLLNVQSKPFSSEWCLG